MRLFRRLVLHEYQRLGLGDWRNFWGGPLPDFDLWRVRFTPSSELLRRIGAGAITAKPDLTQLEANHVIFADGSRAWVDAIIWCTGYTLRFPFLEESRVKVNGDMLSLYKHVFHPDLPNLAFIGFCLVAGPQLPVAEMQARWAAHVFTGAVRLPSAAQMSEAIREQQAQSLRRGAHPMRIQSLEYLDEIARFIEVYPDMIRHWGLLPKLLIGPLMATQYRLTGPGAWQLAGNILQGKET
jgi:dimethylaniline monooxygenase (N-oxide forming)